MVAEARRSGRRDCERRFPPSGPSGQRGHPDQSADPRAEGEGLRDALHGRQELLDQLRGHSDSDSPAEVRTAGTPT